MIGTYRPVITWIALQPNGVGDMLQQEGEC